MKTHAGAVGVVGHPVAHDDTGEPTTRAAIITTTDVLMPLAHRRQPSWHLLYWPSRVLHARISAMRKPLP